MKLTFKNNVWQFYTNRNYQPLLIFFFSSHKTEIKLYLLIDTIMDTKVATYV